VVRDQYHVAYWKVTGGEQGAERANPLAKQAHVSYDIKHSDVTYVVDQTERSATCSPARTRPSKTTLLNAIRQAQGE
jgi:hypothetical protein